jgi:hypothetical protein
VSSGARSPLTRIPEENSPFAIGGDESDDQHDGQDTPSQSSPSAQNSRRPSISSAIDESVPLQLRGMSEKARGKMPAGQPSFSRQNSITSQSSISAMFSTSSGFTPTVAWVSVYSMVCLYFKANRSNYHTFSWSHGYQIFLFTLFSLLFRALLLTFPIRLSKPRQTRKLGL